MHAKLETFGLMKCAVRSRVKRDAVLRKPAHNEFLVCSQ